ncbi:tetratricopeptide repeat protein [Albimonas sp. CAU 1670]|uniref:tetratricopeptide repeat protein n=1 Tax=Albimonas sp. CAU 1670 TaxID=3032599 RepID=UPI0023DBD1D9|nr:tetratricopeptide repeat protein [Albimonas sp. CAU 1670]MDF2234428.1 tetratricopeptide repeat protein [Albimonas sp. CAU 1670]
MGQAGPGAAGSAQTAPSAPRAAAPAPPVAAPAPPPVAPGADVAAAPAAPRVRGPTTPEAKATADALFAPAPRPSGDRAGAAPGLVAAPAAAPPPTEVAETVEEDDDLLSAPAAFFASLFDGEAEGEPEPDLGKPIPAPDARLAVALDGVARAEANEAAARGPGPASRRGWALLESGRAEPAARAFRQALLEEGPTLETLLGLGASYRALGRRRPALDVLSRAAEAWPNSPAARNNLGAALYDMGRLDEAEAEFRAAVDLLARRGLAPPSELSRNLAMVARARGRPLAPIPDLPASVVAAPAPASAPVPDPARAAAPSVARPPVPRPEIEA